MIRDVKIDVALKRKNIKIDGVRVNKKKVNIDVVAPVGKSVAEKYDGEYDVTPTVEGLSLETAHKIMKRDVEIEPIPYAAVSNISGGLTVTIA